ncbi:hypothetical protein BDW72DRAFT_180196 [Aspergillus terricola var. indicus]
MSPLIGPPWYRLATAPHAMTSRLEPCPVRCRCLLSIFGLSSECLDHGSILPEALAGKLRQLQKIRASFLFSQYFIMATALQTRHRSVDPAAEDTDYSETTQRLLGVLCQCRLQLHSNQHTSSKTP